MYPALQSWIMDDCQDPSQFSSTIHREGFSLYPDHCRQYYQPDNNNMVNYQKLFPTNHEYLQYDDRTYITDPSLQNNNMAPCHSDIKMCHSRVHTKQATDFKPPYIYAALICMAIESQKEKNATLREIIHYIESKFPYYRSTKKWHGTIRHDLTVDDCFVKLCPRPGQKASLWTVDPQFQDMFFKGNFRRRRYRFKKGSISWLKAQKQSADKQHQRGKGFHIDVLPR